MLGYLRWIAVLASYASLATLTHSFIHYHRNQKYDCESGEII